MSDDNERQHVCEMAQNVLASLVQEIDSGAMVTRFVALIEVVGSDGDRGLWTVTAPAAMAWDTVGLLTYGLQMEQAALVCPHE